MFKVPPKDAPSLQKNCASFSFCAHNVMVWQWKTPLIISDHNLKLLTMTGHKCWFEGIEGVRKAALSVICALALHSSPKAAKICLCFFMFFFYVFFMLFFCERVFCWAVY